MVNTDGLESSASELTKCAEDLKNLRDRMDKAMDHLRTAGWQGKGEDAFEAIVRDKLGEMMSQYADLIDTLSKLLNETVVVLYKELAEEAKKLSY